MRYLSVFVCCFICGAALSSQTVTGPVNATQASGHQSEAAIAINPTDPLNLVMVSNTDGSGVFKSVSTDGGATWSHTSGFGLGIAIDGLPIACCDPSLAFDKFGNCWLAYLGGTGSPYSIEVVRSVDKGATFQKITTLEVGSVDQPTIAVGPAGDGVNEAVWVLFTHEVQTSPTTTADFMTVSSAKVTGLNAAVSFGQLHDIPGSTSCNFGDIAIGPSGQVAVVYQKVEFPQGNPLAEGPSDVFFNVDPDGSGPAGFFPAVKLKTINVGGFRTIPAQATRSIDSEVSLAYDTSGGPFNGRLYFMYTDAPSVGSADTDILLQTSDDNGTTWTAAKKVNDDTGTATQFFPRMVVDQKTGNMAISFYDCRDDDGSSVSSKDSNGVPNDDVNVYATYTTDGGNSFVTNFKVSNGISNGDASIIGIPPQIQTNEFGDYTGATFYNNKLYVAWSDNSNSTGDNPDGTLQAMDIYASKVTLSVAPAFFDAATINAQVTRPFNYRLKATQNANSFSITNGTLPPGINFDTTTGMFSGTPQQIGNYSLDISATNAAGPGTTTITIAVGKLTPVITWADPASIAYPTPLSATQLNATADVPGTFAYSPDFAAVVPVGQNNQLSVTFTPDDPTIATNASKTVTLVVTKGTPIVTWNVPAAVPLGQPLSATELNATANVPGTFTYTPIIGTVLPEGTQQLSVQFVPTDLANYFVPPVVKVSIAVVTPPVFGGSLTLNAPTTAGTPFTVMSSVSGTAPLVFDFDFGDGTTTSNGTGSATHSYSTPGTYTITLKVTGPGGISATQSATFYFAAPGTPPSDVDSDQDGFSDAIEAVAGTSAVNKDSTPFGGKPAGAPQPLVISKMATKLNFAKPLSDAIQFSGTLPVSDGFNAFGQTVVVDVGGNLRAFTLGAKGSSPTGNATFKVSFKSKSGLVLAQQACKYQVKLSRDDYQSALADEGFVGTADNPGSNLSIMVTVLFDGGIYQKSQAQFYKAKLGKLGASKQPKI